MDSLEIGRTALIKWEKPSYPQSSFHQAAKVRGITIKTKKAGPTIWTVTGIA